MGKLIKKILLVLLPIVFLHVTTVFLDPFNIFRERDNFYNSQITQNREWIVLKLLHKKKQFPQNFIMGSSRSNAYKVSDWCKFINKPKMSCFHYDGIGLGLFRTKNAIKYLDSHSSRIENLLLVVDADFFQETKNPDTYYKIQPPCVSGENQSLFYYKFIEAGIQPLFLVSHVIFLMTKNYYNFMEGRIEPTVFNKSDNNSGDLAYSYADSLIMVDSVDYYDKRIKNGELYVRTQIAKMDSPKIKEKQIKVLLEIQKILYKKNTNVKVVISPLYNQKIFNAHDKKILSDIFGKKNVFDFSGVNELSGNRGNYYESSHYRPCVAMKILKQIYSY